MKQVQTADQKEYRMQSRPRLESGPLYPTKIESGFSTSEHNSELGAQGEFGSLVSETSASFNRPIVVAKIGIIFFVLIVNFLNTRRVKTVKEPVACLQDSGYEWTAELNAELNQNPALLKTFQITSSGLVDLADLTSIVAFWFQSDNARSGSQLAFFYGVRAFLQGNFMFAFPQGGIWDYPGIPSLTVPYGLTSDFYFSGHCGFVTLVVLEHSKLGNKKLAILLSFIIPYLALVLIATRIHYTIDIPIGVLFAWYVHTMLHNHLQQFQYLIRATLNRYCLQKIKFFAEV
jgi:PAP2 superfamily C-terminal